MLTTIEREGGSEQARLIPIIPPEIPGRDHERFINTAVNVLASYPVVTHDEARERLGLPSSILREAVSIPTADGVVYPTFQLDSSGQVHWLVRYSSRKLRSGWERAEWWTTPNINLDFRGRSVPASLLGTEGEREELIDALNALPPLQRRVTKLNAPYLPQES